MHRYLKSALSSYTAQVVPDCKPYEDLTVAKDADLTKLLQPAQLRSSWVDMQGKKSYMFYIIGALDTQFIKDENAEIPFNDLKEEQQQERLDI